jgi:predicted dehydrogenase
MRSSSGVEFNAVCDVYEPSADSAREWAGSGAKVYSDFRKLLENKDVDAVLIATPDHWHALTTIAACQAGKDVYVEKPLAHNIHEGRAMVEAARRHNRIVQVGTQQRSAPHYAEVARILQSGQLGKVHFVRVWNYTNMLPNGIGNAPDSAPPSGLDWDMYLGPAPKVPFNAKRFQATFRWFWDYAGGTITDFGTHRFDTVHQIMGVDRPTTVVATGGRYELKDAGQMPDTMQVTYEYPGFSLSYEMSNISAHGLGGRTPDMKYYNMRGAEDRPHGEAYYGTNGALFCDRIGFEIYPDNDNVARLHENTTDATRAHTAKFIECVRNHRLSDADVEVGHRSTTISHLGNIAYKTGLKLHWDAQKEDFLNAPEASKLLRREPRKPWDLIV